MSAPVQQATLGAPAVWDAIADTYGQDVGSFFTVYAQEALRLVAPDTGAHILDVASGPGTLTFVAAPRVGRVTAVDFSPKMIEALRRRADREGVRNVDVAVMDAQSLEFPDASFDAVFNLFAMMFVPDRARAFREMFRTLRDGGKALLATWAPIDRRPFHKIVFDAMAEALPEIPPMPKGDLQDPKSCMAEMSAAGFREVTTHPFTASMHVKSAEHGLEVMERSGAGFAMLRKKFGEQAWPRAYARLVEALRRRIPEGGIDLSAEAILSLGTR
jgi:ubiquinone/menaquinone biosynthesis C-methylase UbiE